MTTKKISELAAAATLTGTEAVPVVQSGATVKATLAAIAALGGGAVPDATAGVKGKVRLTGDLGGTADSPTVPGLVAKANDSAVVHDTGDESIDGTKTFLDPPVVPTATLSTHAVNKGQAETLIASSSTATGTRPAVKVVATTNQNIGLLSLPPIIDGYQTVDGDRVLLTGQSAAIDNGIWTVVSLLGWSRPADFAASSSQPAGTAVNVASGTAYKASGWVLSGTSAITVGAHAQTWVQDISAVRTIGAQTVAGVKSFSSAPVVPAASFPIAATDGLQAALDATVQLTGAQTVAGVKTFLSAPLVPDNSWAIADTSGLQTALDGKAGSPVAADGLFYATDAGSDANLGLSWGGAKETVASALTDGARYLALAKARFVVPAAISLGTNRVLTLEGVGMDEAIVDGSGLTGTTTMLDLDPGAMRGSSVRNVTFDGPGDVSSVTAIKPYHGFSARSARFMQWGVGVDVRTRNGGYIDSSVEFHDCGVGVKTAIDGNQNTFAARFLFCTIGVQTASNLTNLTGAWFELCTEREVEVLGGSLTVVSLAWLEHTRTTPAIYLNPTASAYAKPVATVISESVIVQGAGATAIMRVAQAAGVTVDDVVIGDGAYAAIQVDRWLMSLRTGPIFAETDDTESDRNYRSPFRVDLEPGAKLYRVTSRDDLVTRPLELAAPAFGGIAHAATTDLLGLGPTTVVAGVVGGTATTAASADAHIGTNAVTFTFAAAGSGSSNFGRINHSFAVTSGQLYTIQFSAKANKPFRAIALRLFNVTPGSEGFETISLDFIDLAAAYNGQRFTIVWKAPATGNFQLAFYKTVVTTNAIVITVSNPAVWAGSVPGPYVLGRTSAVAEGTLAVGRIDLGPDTNLYTTTVANEIRTDDGFKTMSYLHSSDDAFIRVGGTAEIGLGLRGPSSLPGISMGVARDTVIYRSAADTLATQDDFAFTLLGKGIKIAEGSNAKMGTAVLVGGTVTVATTAVTANSRIILTKKVGGGTRGLLEVGTVTAGTSFVINAVDSAGALVADTSTITWLILEPA